MHRALELLKSINQKNFVAGKWTETPEQLEVFNPANDEVIGSVPNLSSAQVSAAIDAAAQGFSEWSKTKVETRSQVLRKWYELVLKHEDALAELITLEQGKVLADAKREVAYASGFLDWYSNVVYSVSGSMQVAGGARLSVEYEPVGVIAAITPWNFPLAMITRKLAPAFAAGCSAILKPSELTPFSALALTKLAIEAGLPANAINIVTGDADRIGQILCDDFRVRKFSFTGSTKVGKLLYQKCAGTLKRVSLELGGNAPFIITADAELEKTATDLVSAKTRSTGQACTSPNRIFAHKSIAAEFAKIIAAKFTALKVGDGFDPKSDIGPLINKAAIEKIERLIKDAQSKGAKIITQFKIEKNMISPTVITNCNDSMEIFRTEIFGPIVAIYEWSEVDEVIKRANDTEYGLQSYIYSNDLSVAQKISQNLDFGMVAINTPIPSNTKAAFGGRKASGFGIEGSAEGIYEYLNHKYLHQSTIS